MTAHPHRAEPYLRPRRHPSFFRTCELPPKGPLPVTTDSAPPISPQGLLTATAGFLHALDAGPAERFLSINVHAALQRVSIDLLPEAGNVAFRRRLIAEAARVLGTAAVTRGFNGPVTTDPDLDIAGQISARGDWAEIAIHVWTPLTGAELAAERADLDEMVRLDRAAEVTA